MANKRMKLHEWRSTHEKTLNWLGQKLGFSGSNPARSAQRIEIGLARPDANIVEKIIQTTGGAVTAQDMHETRLAWLALSASRAKGAAAARAVLPARSSLAVKQTGEKKAIKLPDGKPQGRGKLVRRGVNRG